MISKELLREVLGVNPALIDYNKQTKELELRDLNIDGECVGGGTINIYELAHKCKEWACENECEVESFIDTFDKTAIARANFIHRFDDSKCFHADTEAEAVFRACQWILENKEK